jgi:putative transposase
MKIVVCPRLFSFKASLVDSEAFALICYRYIELNPVRANMVQHPAEYPWSRYRRNALGHDDALITPHYLYEDLGDLDESRQARYQKLFEAHIDHKTIDDVRQCANKAWVLGSDYFKAKIELQLNRRAKPSSRGGDRRSNEFKNVNFNGV